MNLFDKTLQGIYDIRRAVKGEPRLLHTKFGDIKVLPYPWEVKRTSGLLPTKASVSLVWMISSKKGGERR